MCHAFYKSHVTEHQPAFLGSVSLNACEVMARGETYPRTSHESAEEELRLDRGEWSTPHLGRFTHKCNRSKGKLSN
jgi:hypothetical protein